MRYCSLLELLYADDLILCIGSVEVVMEINGKWKGAVEGKKVRASFGKTKVMEFLESKTNVSQKIGPCCVCVCVCVHVCMCGEKVGCNSVKCLQYLT